MIFSQEKKKEDRRSIDRDPEHLIAPCDGLLSVWKIEEGTVLPIKQSHYTVSSLLRNEKIAKALSGWLLSGISPVRRSLSQILLCGFRKEEQKYSSAGNFSYGKAGGIRSASGVYGKQQGVHGY